MCCLSTRSAEIRSYFEQCDPVFNLAILTLPEGVHRPTWFLRLLQKGKFLYDPLWRYIKPVDKKLHKGQGSQIRFGEFQIGLMSHNRVPIWIDFAKELVFVGRQLTIPIPSLRSLVVAHELLTSPFLNKSGYDLLLRAEGCAAYIPIHRFIRESEILDTAAFLSKRLRIPLGVVSKRLQFYFNPETRLIQLADRSELPIETMRSLLYTKRSIDSIAVSLLTTQGKVVLFNETDPEGAIESVSRLIEQLFGVATRHFRPSFELAITQNN